ncbi:AaceriAER084Wp [[Ashbya] aceris (nom. inval.)]|nr:AaceriAER084Wp [[Ashbya] aceris (nom. inval.)]
MSGRQTRERQRGGALDFQQSLQRCRGGVQDSDMLADLKRQLEPHREGLTRIRCLALGKFHDEAPARWQLALLLELVDYLGPGVQCSVYDPAFTAEELAFVEQLGEQWSVDEQSPWSTELSDQVLFFLPHAPLSLSESVVEAEQPRLWLANQLVQHTDRYTKAQLFEKYPLISKLVSYLDSGSKAGTASNDGFSTFVPKRSRRQRRNKAVFTEPNIDYGSVRSYFTGCAVLTDFCGGELLRDKPWLNAFSDLALHRIELGVGQAGDTANSI